MSDVPRGPAVWVVCVTPGCGCRTLAHVATETWRHGRCLLCQDPEFRRQLRRQDAQRQRAAREREARGREEEAA